MKNRQVLWVKVAILLAGVLLFARLARTDDSKQDFRRYYERGQSLYREGKFQEASESFEKARRLLREIPTSGSVVADHSERSAPPVVDTDTADVEEGKPSEVQDLKKELSDTKRVSSELKNKLRQQEENFRQVKQLLEQNQAELGAARAERQLADEVMQRLEGENQLRASYEALQKQLKDAQQQTQASSQETKLAVAQMTEELAEARAQVEVKDREVTRLTSVLEELQKQLLARASSGATTALPEIQTAQFQNEALIRELDSTRDAKSRLENNLVVVQKKQDELVLNLAKVQRELVDKNGQLQTTHLNLDQSQETIGRLMQEMSEIRQGTAGQTGGLATIRTQLQAKEEEIRQFKAAWEEALHQLAQRDRELGLLQVELEKSRKDQESLRQELEVMEVAQSRMKSDFASGQQSKESVEAESVRLQQNLRAVKQTLNTKDAALLQTQRIVAYLTEENKGVERGAADLTKELATVRVQSQAKDKAMERLTLEVQERSKQTSELSQELIRRMDRYTQLRTQSDVMAQELDGSRQAMAHMGQELADAQRKQEQLQQNLGQVQAVRDALLRQLESQARNQAELEKNYRDLRAQSSVPTINITTIPPIVVPAPGAPVAPVPQAKSAQSPMVKVYRVGDKQGYLVLSVEGLQGIKAGSSLTLILHDQPVAEVELADVDKQGVAMAYITKQLNPGVSIKDGDLLTVKPVVKNTTETK